MLADRVLSRPLLRCEALVHDCCGDSRCSIEPVKLAAREHRRADRSEVVRADRRHGARWAVLLIDRSNAGGLVRAASWYSTRGREADGCGFHAWNRFQTRLETIEERDLCRAIWIPGFRQMQKHCTYVCRPGADVGTIYVKEAADHHPRA